MTEKQADAAAGVPERLTSLGGTLNLLGGADAAGMCIGGVCRIPGFDTKDASKPE